MNVGISLFVLQSCIFFIILMFDRIRNIQEPPIRSLSPLQIDETHCWHYVTYVTCPANKQLMLSVGFPRTMDESCKRDVVATLNGSSILPLLTRFVSLSTFEMKF